MSLNWAVYEPATGCVSYGPQGCQALLVYTEDVFAELHRSLGICNCRATAGGTSWSHHAECRALDMGFAVIVGRTFAYEYAVILGEHGSRVGIDHIITNRKPWASDRGEPVIFSARSPEGRVYTGTHPHKDHNHTGLTRNAGRRLTYATLVAVYGRPEDVARKLLLRQIGDEEMLYGLNIGKWNDPAPADAPANRVLQAFLVGQGQDIGSWGPNGDGVDGRPGNDTRGGLSRWKIANGITGTKSAGEGVIGHYEIAAIYASGGVSGTHADSDHTTLATKSEVQEISDDLAAHTVDARTPTPHS